MDFYAAGTDVARSCVDKQCIVCDEHIELDDDIYADLDETVSQVQHARCFTDGWCGEGQPRDLAEGFLSGAPDVRGRNQSR